jgi:hypothetical protein
MKLFEIANEYKTLLDNSFEYETGEINATSISRLDELAGDLKEKGIAVASYIKNMEAERRAIYEASKSMMEREERLSNQIYNLESYLQSNMERCDIKEISCPYFVVKLKKCPISVEILDENDIPDEYKNKKEIISIDKIKIKEDLLSGTFLRGAALKQKTRLEIK